MRFAIASIIFLFIFFIYPQYVHAIILLPAVILIPVAKIVAVVIGGLSLPAVGLGTVGSKLFKKSTKKTLLIIIASLLIIGFGIAIVLKIENPSRPLF